MSQGEWTDDTGEFIDLYVPEEHARERLSNRVQELKDTIDQMATFTHNKYHKVDNMFAFEPKTWKECPARTCSIARETLKQAEQQN
jgi:hypothetical protein